jgi:hypothetical protein
MILHRARFGLLAGLIAACLAHAACRGPGRAPAHANASENARISRGMEEVKAGQARSEKDEAAMAAAARNASDHEQRNQER